ncbi:MAG TPA: glycosyl hydrolase family 18 protein [Candidatus Limnocylindrales bacterium]
MPRPRIALDVARPALSAGLALVLAAGALPSPVGAAAPTTPVFETLPAAAAQDVPPTRADEAPPAIDDAVTPEQHPSIAYEEAMAHADDVIAFEPGGRVKVGFRPRADDDWPVDNRAPTSLPAGRATGHQMAASLQGSQWATVRGASAPSTVDAAGDGAETSEAPVDAPGGAPSIGATASSYALPDARPEADLAAAPGLRRQVFGFLPYWELSGASSKINHQVLSTIAYFSVGADRDGNLRKKGGDGRTTTGWGGWTSSNMTSVISNAHRHGTRVVLTLSVFAWTTAQANTQRAILGSKAARVRLARQAVAAVRDRGADGVNLDFEPLASGYADEFVALLRTFRTELNKVRKGYQLTYDTTGYIGNYPLEASVGKGAADAIFVMGYDYRTSSSGRAGSIDPLSGPAYDLADTVRAYTARVSPSRIILGLPWYGRAWSTEDKDPRSKTLSGAKYGYSAAVNYENVVGLVAKHGRKWDALERSPYVVYRRENCTSTYGCVTSWRQVYFDDAASLKQRYAIVNDYGLRGAGMWALGYDGGHAELNRALSESFRVDKSAPQAGIRMLASAQGDEGFVVSWTARDTSTIASYDVQVSVDGGPWAAWRTRTRARSEVWLGSDGHGYAFRVRAVDSKGNAGSWNVGSRWDGSPRLEDGGFGRVVADGLAYRSGPDASAARLGTLPAGTIVAITRGPVSSDGYSWYEVTEPIREWSPVSFVERGVWIAARSSSDTMVKPYRAPNSTTVNAGIRGLNFGSGSASGVGSGPTARAVRAFSPNGDGWEDAVRLRWTNTVALDSLTLNVYRTNGTLVGSRTVPDVRTGAQTWDWNGAAGGSTVRDGRYVLQLVGKAGARTFRAPSIRPVTGAQVGAFAVTVDTVRPKIKSASASSTLISPNGDDVRESVRFALTSTGSTRWALQIASAGAGTVGTIDGGGTSFGFTWRGEKEGGGRAPDGRYTTTLSAIDDAGNRARRSFTVTLDTTPPSITTAATPGAFSPDGDGALESTRLSWTANGRATGTVRILKGSTEIRRWPINHASSWATTWDGRNAAGKRVADGRYEMRVSLVDPGGNRRTVDRALVVDRTGGFLRWSRSFFPQDADSLAPTSALTWRLARDARTSLRLYDASGTLVRTVWTGKAQHAGDRKWTWNGRLAGGSFAPQGRYEARLTVASTLGTVVLSRTVWASAFSVTPSATKVRPGQTLKVTFTTVEPLTSRPTVAFRQPGRSAATVTATKRSDGSYTASFKVRSGGSGTGSIRVSAKDAGGGLNRTTVAIRIAS